MIDATWAGYDFLAAARNDTLWNKAMVKVKEAGVGATIEIMKRVLTNLANQAVGGYRTLQQ